MSARSACGGRNVGDEMSPAREMLETYPRTFNVNGDVLARTIETLIECANTCTQCADACLSESALSAELAKCIRFESRLRGRVHGNQPRVISRQTEYDANLTRPLLEACAAVCKSCGDECGRHGEHMDHCRVCAASCRRCESACRELLAAMQ